MVRLGISVEGATEREFVSRVLAPELARHQVYVSPIDMRGRVSLQRISREINSLLAMFDFVTTFYDFYGFQKRPQGNVEYLEAAISDLVLPEQKHRFMPYIQQYEFEALVLAAHEQAEIVMAIESLGSRLHKIVAASGGAENVNDGYETCPSRRIQALAPQYEKKFHGPVILEKGLAAARAGCPRFDAWLTQLSQLTVQGGA